MSIDLILWKKHLICVNIQKLKSTLYLKIINVAQKHDDTTQRPIFMEMKMHIYNLQTSE